MYRFPVVPLDGEQPLVLRQIIDAIKKELEQDESGMEEMLRILLKQIIILSTRIWKTEFASAQDPADKQNGKEENGKRENEKRKENGKKKDKGKDNDTEFMRSFSQLVEWHYTRYHSVADYAQLLHMTPKALNKRITRDGQPSPNELIKNRIILEAKRLLVHTSLSVKEIGYKLGYDDVSYFIRLFTAQAGRSPQNFRLQYQPSIS